MGNFLEGGNLLDEKTANSVKLATSATETKDYIIFNGVKDLNIGIMAFNRIAGAAYAESRNQDHDEVFAFSNAFVNNAKNTKRNYDQLTGQTDNNGPPVSNAITDGNDRFEKFMTTTYANNTPAMNQAQAGLINALTGGKDYSNGADHWDGNDALTGIGQSLSDINRFYTHRAHGEFKGVYDPSEGALVCQFWDNVVKYSLQTKNNWILNHIQDFPLYNNFNAKDKAKYNPYMIVKAVYATSIFYKSNDYYDNKNVSKYKPAKPAEKKE